VTEASNANDSRTTTAVPGSTVEVMDYSVPLCPDSHFDGRDVLASFLDVMMTHFWTDKSWITNVELYEHVVPQTITTC
jgi:hypothetical protein